jgi:hypothetical protein
VPAARHDWTRFGAPRAARASARPQRRLGVATGGRRLVGLGLLALLPLLLTSCSSRTSASLAGPWLGAYTCGDGLTGLTLEIGEPLGDHVPATFSFYALPSNPEVPSGRFWMGGRREGDDRLVLTAGGWLDRPAGYELLDLDGTLSEDRRTYSGIVVGSTDCTGFFVSRGD